jgi:hypothetical protein
MFMGSPLIEISGNHINIVAIDSIYFYFVVYIIITINSVYFPKQH